MYSVKLLLCCSIDVPNFFFLNEIFFLSISINSITSSAPVERGDYETPTSKRSTSLDSFQRALFIIIKIINFTLQMRNPKHTEEKQKQKTKQTKEKLGLNINQTVDG